MAGRLNPVLKVELGLPRQPSGSRWVI